MSALEFDELNEFEKYFEPMEISAEQKSKRVEIANAIYDAILFFFSAIKVFSKNGNYTKEYYANMLYGKLDETITEHTGIDSALREYIKTLAQEVANTTYEKIFHKSNPSFNGVDNTALSEERETNYWLSESRAFFIATNEANTILNYSDYIEAIESGKTMKRWLTMRDEKVRMSHYLIDGTEVDIEDVFYVGNSVMRFPHDFEYCTDPNEIIRCRCAVEYF